MNPYSCSLQCRYEQAEFIERELEQMQEQIKSIVQTLNANQVNPFSFLFPRTDELLSSN